MTKLKKEKSPRVTLSIVGLWLRALFFCLVATSVEANKPFVRGELLGQLGNQMFEVATTCALAWDNGAEPFFPDHAQATNWVVNYPHMFSRCNQNNPGEIEFEWGQPGFFYTPIPYRPNMKISGYFQSEKFFAHHRERILSLFAPNKRDFKYIRKKYQNILNHPQTVGIQIRYYKWEFPSGGPYPQYGKDYLEKAMAHFSPDSLFIISSNNVPFAKKSIPAWARNVLFLEGEPAYIDLFLLSFCKNNIITNSSFGWWAAWLNNNPNKVVICPEVWDRHPTQDVIPDKWTKISSNEEQG